MKDAVEQIATDLGKIKEEKPLVHHITNFVVMNETANATLCLGALPVMAHANEEVSEMVQAAGALALNIGTLTPELVDSMVIAGKRANELNVPIVLDPVGAGATTLRTEASRRLIEEPKIDIIRGNSAEVSILAGRGGEIKGVEAVGDKGSIEQIAKEFASEKENVVAITGKEDVVSDGRRTAIIKNGDFMLSTITGTGCMATTTIAAFAATEEDRFLAAAGGLVVFGLAGEKAAAVAKGRPGTFHVALYDALATLTPEDIVSGAKIEISSKG